MTHSRLGTRRSKSLRNLIASFRCPATSIGNVQAPTAKFGKDVCGLHKGKLCHLNGATVSCTARSRTSVSTLVGVLFVVVFWRRFQNPRNMTPRRFPIWFRFSLRPDHSICKMACNQEAISAFSLISSQFWLFSCAPRKKMCCNVLPAIGFCPPPSHAVSFFNKKRLVGQQVFLSGAPVCAQLCICVGCAVVSAVVCTRIWV